MGWIIAILTASPALLMADTEVIVGTWRRADMSLVEFKTDGIVATEAGIVGKWERLGNAPKYLLRFTGAKDHYYVTVGGYKRLLTMEQQLSRLKTCGLSKLQEQEGRGTRGLQTSDWLE